MKDFLGKIGDFMDDILNKRNSLHRQAFEPSSAPGNIQYRLVAWPKGNPSIPHSFEVNIIFQLDEGSMEFLYEGPLKSKPKNNVVHENLIGNKGKES